MATRLAFYEVLGVPSDATRDEIQRAYRALARRYHPDVNADPAAHERFKQISEAYRVLSDPSLRARYDRHGQRGRDAAEPENGPAAGTPGRRVRVHTRDFGLFATADSWLFGAGGLGEFGPRGSAGQDIEVEVELTVEEAYRGGRRTVRVPGVTGSRSCDVSFPPGASDGTRIQIAGLGLPGSGGGRNGDLYLAVRLARHRRYQVDDRDVTVDLPVSPWEAALGSTVTLDTPAGPALVALPAGSSSGRRLRLHGRGIPNADGPAGDLYATVRIVVPSDLTALERRFFQRLAHRSQFQPRPDTESWRTD
jgi:curved DNA-binding protein